MMKAKFSATFEFDEEAPRTYKGEVQASGLSTMFRLAAKELQKAYPGSKWTSVVIVLDRSGHLP
jgi:hypothetical protein